MKRTAEFTLFLSAVIIAFFAVLALKTNTVKADGGHSHCLCADQTMEDAASHVCVNLAYQSWTTNNALPKVSGSYYLDTDVTLTESWVLPAGVDIKLCLNGHTISGSGTHVISTYGSSHNENVHLSITDCKGTGVIQNTVASNPNNGGVLFFGSNGGSFHLYAGTLKLASGCKGTLNGAVAYVCGGTVNMYGGALSDGKTSQNGANLQVNDTAEFNMYGGKITNGYATKNGGGVYLFNGSFTMYGGEISGNTTEDSGGNIAVQYQAVFTMKGGIIKDGIAQKTNKNYFSANIFVHATGANSRAYFEGGTIKGRVFVMAINLLGFSGTPVIHDGTYGIGIGNTNTAVKQQKLTIGTPDKEHLEAGADIYVLSFARTGNTNFTFQTGDSQYVLAFNANETDAKYFSTNRSNYTQPAYHDGLLILQNLKSHCLCGGTLLGRKNADGTAHTCTNVTWTAWDGSESTMPTTTGNYYISGNFTNTALNCISDGATINIDLNGQRITSSASRLYTTYTGTAHVSKATWSFSDSSLSTGEVKMDKSTTDQGAIVWGSAKSKSVLTIYGGTYYASNTSYVTAVNKHGAMFSLKSASSDFILYDGTIRGGHAKGFGGNIYQYATSASTFTMMGGTVQGGISDSFESGTSYSGGIGGNICVSGAVTVKILGGTVRNGAANYGVKPSLEVYNGLGGNIYISVSKPVTIQNLTVSNGKARVGGNIALLGTGTKTISDSLIQNGDASEDTYIYYESGSTEKKYLSVPGYAANLYTESGLTTVTTTTILGSAEVSSVYPTGTSLSIQSGEFTGLMGGTQTGYISGGYFDVRPLNATLKEDYYPREVSKESEKVPELYLNYQVIQGFEVFTASVAGGEMNIAQTMGGGVYATGDKPTVKALPVSGYRFTGWYLEDEAGQIGTTPIGTDYTYTFATAPTTTVSLVAVYEADDTMVTLTVYGQKFRVKAGEEAAVNGETEYVALYKKGTQVVLTYTGTEKPFLAWRNNAGKLVSRDSASYTFTIGATTILHAQEKTGAQQKNVLFYNDKQQVLKTVTGNTIAKADIPSSPLRVGQIFKGWRVCGTEELFTEDDVVAKINELLTTETVVEIETVYGAEETKITIYLQKYKEAAGVLTKVGSKETLSIPSTGIKEIAAAETLGTGEKFAYAAIQKNSDLEKVSTTPTFMIKAFPGETVFLVYASEATDKHPVISMTQAISKEEGNGTYTYSFASSRNIPDSYEVLTHGLILTNETLLSGEGLKAAAEATRLDAKRNAVVKSNDLTNNGVMTLNLSNVPNKDLLFYVRAFAVLKDQTGAVTTIYSDLMYGSAAVEYDLFKEETEFSEGATIQESLEIGSKNTTVYLDIVTKDGVAPKSVTLTSSNDKIKAIWTKENPTRISVSSAEIGVNGTISAVVDGVKAGSCAVTVVAHSHAAATLSDIKKGEGEAVSWTAWTDSTKLPKTTGNYYLETDVETTTLHTIPSNADVKLCLNGHSVVFTGTARLYSTYSSKTISNSHFTLCDCREDGGEILCDSNVNTAQGTFYWGTGTSNELTIYGGTIRGGENYQTKSYGALVCMEKDSVCRMYGGEIKDGFNTLAGGNVGVQDTAKFYMYGGTISGGSVFSNDKNNTYGGNVYMSGSCRFEMYEGAVVKGGEARENIYAAIATTGVHQGHGGNFYLKGGATLISDGGVITDGYCSVCGGNIQIENSTTTVTLKDTEVSNGFSWMAGGIYLASGTLNLEGKTVITGNTYSGGGDSRGGGLYVGNGTLNISGTPYIYDNVNKATKCQSNLMLAVNTVVNLGEMSGDAKIGVTCAKSSSSPASTGTAAGFALNATGKGGYFVADERTSYSVKENGSKLDLVVFEGDFQVGFARAEVTPETSVPLAGYGRTQYRMSTNLLDNEDLTVTCIAITGDGGTVLMFTVDTIRVGWVDDVRMAVSEATGVPANNILMTATHTHSGPDVGFSNTAYTEAYNAIMQYKTKYVARFAEVAAAAMEDRADVAITYSAAIDTVYKDKNGKTLTMNWVRHYTLVDKNGNYAGVKGDNFNQLYNKTYKGSVDAEGDLINPSWVDNGTTISGHTTEADPSLRLIKFVRADGKKDVVLMNWRAHPTKTGGSAKTDISADIIAPFRNELEKQTGCLAAYFQGASGNLNTSSSISGETYASSYIQYGKKLAEFAIEGLKNATEVACDGSVEVLYESYTGLRKNADYYSAEEVAAATKIYNYYQANGNSSYLYELCRLSGNMVHSGYDASSIVGKAKSTATTVSIPIYAFRIGNLAFTEAPYEMFDTNSKYIREQGLSMGFDNVFVMGYSNGSASYVPSQIGFTQGTETLFGSYESDQCQFRPIQYYVDSAGNHYDKQNDTQTLTPVYVGEDLAFHFEDLLKTLKQNQ